MIMTASVVPCTSGSPQLLEFYTDHISKLGLRTECAGRSMVAKPKKNLLPGQGGEGPPIAPDGWKWRCGLRAQDMYFTAPDGTRFRARRPLNDYLKTLPNPPAPTDFIWTITPEVLDQNPALQAYKTETPPQKTVNFKKKKGKAAGKTGGESKGRKSRK